MKFPIYLMPWKKLKRATTTEPEQYTTTPPPGEPQMTAVITPEPPAPEKPEEPKTRKIITKMRVVNNRNTNIYYEYDNEEGNPFGLTWYVGKGGITIAQKYSADGERWDAIGRFIEHSVTYIKWEYVTIAPDEPNKIRP
ncbi:MAG: hypothetical protein WC341_16830 [Bacteroidales bacterium]|jgi:hypothetical protein